MEKKILLSIGIGCLTVLALHAAITPTQSVPADTTEQKSTEQEVPAVPPVPAPYPLHDACKAEDINQLNDAIKTLTDNGTLANHINEQDTEGNTALHFAAQANQNTLALVQALIDADANIKIPNNNDALPMDFIIADDPQNDPCSQLLAVSDEDRQEAIMQARQKEIDANNAIDETAIINNKITVIAEDNADFD